MPRLVCGDCRRVGELYGPPLIAGVAGENAVGGLVPDGVESVTIGTAKGDVVAKVDENTYSADLPSVPTSFSYQGPDGTYRKDFGRELDPPSPAEAEAMAAQQR